MFGTFDKSFLIWFLLVWNYCLIKIEKMAIIKGRDENVSLTSTEKKSVIDVVAVDRRPSWTFLLDDVDQEKVSVVDVDRWRSTFIYGRRLPDWGFLMVDVLFYWNFHHALIKQSFLKLKLFLNLNFSRK